MTERAVYGILALAFVALCLLAMASLHREHYKGRRWQLLESRVQTLEKIIVGNHE